MSKALEKSSRAHHGFVLLDVLFLEEKLSIEIGAGLWYPSLGA